MELQLKKRCMTHKNKAMVDYMADLISIGPSREAFMN